MLASELVCLIYNPSYEVFRKTLPKKFHNPGYLKVKHIIDCTEVFKWPSSKSSNLVRLQAPPHCQDIEVYNPQWCFQFCFESMGRSNIRCACYKRVRILWYFVMADRGFTSSTCKGPYTTRQAWPGKIQQIRSKENQGDCQLTDLCWASHTKIKNISAHKEWTTNIYVGQPGQYY